MAKSVYISLWKKFNERFQTRPSRFWGMGGFYTLPPMPVLLNINQFYPEIKSNDLEAAELYQDYFIKDKFHRYYEGSMKGTPIFRTIPVENLK